MIEQRGQIVAFRGSMAVVSAQRQSGCSNCSKQHGSCGNSMILQLFGAKQDEFLVQNPIQAHLGDQVIIGITEQSFLRATILLYGIPLLTLIIGLLIGQEVGKDYPNLDRELLSLLGGLLGVIAGFAWTGYLNYRNSSKTSSCIATILRLSGN